MSGCGPKEAVSWCTINSFGHCNLETASFEEMDRLAPRCGMIRVNNRYLSWKYGVTFKELICGNCSFYVTGMCTNEQVIPHTKGIKENGETVYIDSKEYYSGALACGKFVKREVEEVQEACIFCGHMAEGHCDIHNSNPIFIDDSHGCKYWQSKDAINKIRCEECQLFSFTTPANTWGRCPKVKKEIHGNWFACSEFAEKEDEELSTFYTKCGREFKKSTNASVTGYTINENDKECADCPFQVDVKEGWPQVHKRWECRAGSKKPNQKDEWRGCVDDKNTIKILSLHNDFLESVMEYCKDDPDLAASYNQDEDDCRRAISVSCSSNKKGMAAKKALVNKFFPVKTSSAKKYQCGKCDIGHWYSNENTYVSVVDDAGKTIKRNCESHTHYCYQFDEGQKKISSDKDFNPESAPDWCPLDKDIAVIKNDHEDEEVEESQDMLDVFDNGELDPDDNDESPIEDVPELKKPRAGSEGCQEMREDCPAFCKHNDGCAVLLVRGDSLKSLIRDSFENKNIDCDVYRRVRDRVLGNQVEEPIPEMNKLNVSLSSAPVGECTSFDYGTLDQDTSAFLQEKASKITQINAVASYAVGKELKEAQEKLASHDKTKGTFVKWIKSLNISDDTAYNYIHVYDFVSERFGNIGEAENFLSLPQKLQYAVSKPSASAELQEAVLSGDITTHKEYKDLEAKLKEAERLKSTFSDSYNRVADQNHKLNEERNKERQARLSAEKVNYDMNLELNKLKLQLDQAKRNGDPEKIQELGEVIADKQREILAIQQDKRILNDEINSLRKQLREKPIEATATKEVIPDSIQELIASNVANLLTQIEYLEDEEIKIYASRVDSDAIDLLNNCITRLGDLLDAVKAAE